MERLMACSRCGKEGHYRKRCPEPSPEAKAAAAARMADKCKHEIARETCALCKANGVPAVQASARPGDGGRLCTKLKRVHPNVGPRWDLASCSLPLHHAGLCRFDGPLTRSPEAEVAAVPLLATIGHPADASDAEVHRHLRIWLGEASERLRRRLDEFDRLRALYLGDDTGAA